MAIDSRVKRDSVASVSRRYKRGVTVDATKPQAWRQAVGWGYSGINAGSPVVAEISLVCGSISIFPAVGGTIGISPAVTGTIALNRGCE